MAKEKQNSPQDNLMSLTGKPLEEALGEILPTLAKYQNGFDKVPVALTPDNAFKWRDWAVEKFGATKYTITMNEMDKSALGFLFIASDAQPCHYILAAALCEIRSKK